MSFGDIRNNQGQGKCYQQSRKDIKKHRSNNCFISHYFRSKVENNDKLSVAQIRTQFDTAPGNHALYAQPAES